MGGAETAAHDHGIGVDEQPFELGDDAPDVVADLHLQERVDAVGCELLPHPGGVGVDDLSEQQLGAHSEDVATHQAARDGVVATGRGRRAYHR